jgi:hypothetical protein
VTEETENSTRLWRAWIVRTPLMLFLFLRPHGNASPYLDVRQGGAWRTLRAQCGLTSRETGEQDVLGDSILCFPNSGDVLGRICTLEW